VLISLQCWNRLHDAVEEPQAKTNCGTNRPVLAMTSVTANVIILSAKKKRAGHSTQAKGVRT